MPTVVWFTLGGLVSLLLTRPWLGAAPSSASRCSEELLLQDPFGQRGGIADAREYLGQVRPASFSLPPPCDSPLPRPWRSAHDLQLQPACAATHTTHHYPSNSACLSLCPDGPPFVMAAAGGRGHSGCLEHHAAVWQVQVRCTACCTASSCETSWLIALAVELAALPGLSMCPARRRGCSIA